jgi:hypothetical protein
MAKKSQRRAKLIRPDDPGHGVTFERFSEIVLDAGLEKIEKELERASGLAARLKRSAALIWRSRDPAITNPLAPFGTMFQEWQPLHSSGVAFVGLLHEFEFTTKLLADRLVDDPGGPRRANALDDFLIWLEQYHRMLAHVSLLRAGCDG